MPQMRSARDTCDGTAFTEVKWAYACWRPIFTTRTKPACPCLSYAKEAVDSLPKRGVQKQLELVLLPIERTIAPFRLVRALF